MTKIFRLVKVHVKICQNLKVIYLQNLQDIRNVVGSHGHTLMSGFLGMTHTTNPQCTVPLIHSVHNMGRTNIKAVLIPQENYEIAVDQFGGLHQGLLAGIPQQYHANVFVDNLEANMTSGHRDTIQSCNSSHNASELLQLYNPQNGETGPPATDSQKRFRPTVISYAAVVSGTPVVPVVPSSTPSTQGSTSISSLMDSDLDQLYERLKHHVEVVDDSSPRISVEEMEKIVQQSNKNISQVQQEMRDSVAQLATSVDHNNIAMKKQNAVVVGLQKTMEATVTDLKASVNTQVMTISSEILALCSLDSWEHEFFQTIH